MKTLYSAGHFQRHRVMLLLLNIKNILRILYYWTFFRIVSCNKVRESDKLMNTYRHSPQIIPEANTISTKILLNIFI